MKLNERVSERMNERVKLKGGRSIEIEGKDRKKTGSEKEETRKKSGSEEGNAS